jgi:hypothetical protein
MSQQNFLRFLSAASVSPVMRARYNPRNLSQLIFHAKNEGFDFTQADIAAVVGPLEYTVATQKDRTGDLPAEMNGSSPLWRTMWGLYHLEYILDHVLSRFTQQELAALFPQQGNP